MQTIKKRNNSIDIFRLVCAIMVVAIHAQPFSEINGMVCFFASRVMTGIAVPFFFAVAGYYYIKSLQAGKSVFQVYIKKLLVVYSLWSIIYFILTILLNMHNQDFSVMSTLKQFIIPYFINGSYYHLWFFPALFFAVIVTTIFYKLHCMHILAYASFAFYFLGCLSCAYKNIAVKIPLISSLINSPNFTTVRRIVLMGLPFFLMGYFIHVFIQRHPKIQNRQLFVFVGISLFLYFAEIAIVMLLHLQKNISITFALYPLLFGIMLLLLKNPLDSMHKAANLCHASANFMYYSHPIFLVIFSSLSGVLNITIPSVIVFSLTVILAFCCGLIINKIDNKYINKLVF